jgi:hypothetical protein
MNAKEFFGLERVEEDNPDWVWFLDPANYSQVLGTFQVSENIYLNAWGEVLNVFPRTWARKTMLARIGGPTAQGIHPPFFGWLHYHPVAHFLSQHVFAWSSAVHVLRLGMELLNTRDIPRIQSLRRDLKNLDQYIGRLFELEVLSDLAARGLQPSIYGTPDFRFRVGNTSVYAEARHRGLPFGMATTFGIHPPIDANWHSIRVTLRKVSGTRSDMLDLELRINRDIAEMFRSPADSIPQVVREDYTIEHTEDGEARTMSISYGKDESWRSELRRVTHLTLVEKSKQIRPIALSGHRVALMMDCRSLVSPLAKSGNPSVDKHNTEQRNSVLDAGAQFLEENQWVSGIVWWWKHTAWAKKLAEDLHQPWHFSVSTSEGHKESFEPTDLLNGMTSAPT